MSKENKPNAREQSQIEVLEAQIKSNQRSHDKKVEKLQSEMSELKSRVEVEIKTALAADAALTEKDATIAELKEWNSKEFEKNKVLERRIKNNETRHKKALADKDATIAEMATIHVDDLRKRDAHYQADADAKKVAITNLIMKVDKLKADAKKTNDAAYYEREAEQLRVDGRQNKAELMQNIADRDELLERVQEAILSSDLDTMEERELHGLICFIQGMLDLPLGKKKVVVSGGRVSGKTNIFEELRERLKKDEIPLNIPNWKSFPKHKIGDAFIVASANEKRSLAEEIAAVIEKHEGAGKVQHDKK